VKVRYLYWGGKAADEDGLTPIWGRPEGFVLGGLEVEENKRRVEEKLKGLLSTLKQFWEL
jgi:hypothetical protein